MALDNDNVSAKDSSLAILSKGKGNTINVFQQMATLPSVLNPLLEKIIENYQPSFDEAEGEASPEVEDKISFNSVKVHAQEIRDNCGYMSLIEQVLDDIDDEKPGAKNTFLWAIHQKYKSARKSLFIEYSVDPADREAVMAVICANADRLISQVATDIIDTAKGNLSFSIELVEAAKELVVCFGFINCKILERPDDSI